MFSNHVSCAVLIAVFLCFPNPRVAPRPKREALPPSFC